MLKRITIAAMLALFSGLFAAQAQAAPPTDFWLNKPFLNMAHAGSADEAPANTLFAFKEAVKNGADQIEMDGYVTKDGEFVITHDVDPYKSSNAPGEAGGQERIDNQIANRTLAELKQLDFAYKFSPGKGHHDYSPDDPHPYRGMALEDGPEPPAGYTRNDFRIVTLEEVLDALPNTPLNVDMKAPYSNQQMATDAADVVAEIMKKYPERSEDVIIASFFQGAMERFHELVPAHKALTASEAELKGYAFENDPITPVPVALQPPDNYPIAIGPFDTVPFLKANAVRDGYAIHVWPQNGSIDGPELWQKVLDQGANGFFTDRVTELNEFLCEKGVPKPDGSSRCVQTECPPDTIGTPPDCEPITGPDGAKVKKVKFQPAKGKLKAGKKRTFTLAITASKGEAARVNVSLKSSNRQVKVPARITVNLRPGKTVRTKVTVRATRKAKGKAQITATTMRKVAKTKLTVIRAKK